MDSSGSPTCVQQWRGWITSAAAISHAKINKLSESSIFIQMLGASNAIQLITLHLLPLLHSHYCHWRKINHDFVDDISSLIALEKASDLERSLHIFV